jgi:hypothetical protein
MPLRLPSSMIPRAKVEPDPTTRYTMKDLTAQEVETLHRSRFKNPKSFGRWMVLIFVVCAVIFFTALRRDAAVPGGTWYWKVVAVASGFGPFLWWHLKSMRPMNRYGEEQLSKTQVTR